MTLTTRGRCQRRLTLGRQFSLRTLLVIVTVFGVWLGRVVENARDQRIATESILQVRGQVKYDYQIRGEIEPPGPKWLRRLIGDDYFCTVVEATFDFEPPRADDHALRYINRLRHLRSLDLQETQITDAGLAHLEGLDSLRRLNLERTAVTGAGLQHISRLRQLEWLCLRNARATNCGMALSQMTHLTHLDLTHTGVTDDDARHLRSLRKLRWLSLGGATKITDASLITVGGLTELEWLSLGATQATDAGASHLCHLHTLTFLDTWGTRITAGAKQQLRRELPRLTTFP